MDEDLLEERLHTIVERLAPMRPIRVVVFGSTGRGEADRLSDFDLLVVAENVSQRFGDRIAQAYDLIDPRFALDLFIYTPAEYRRMLEAGNPLVERAEAEGRVIYERSAA